MVHTKKFISFILVLAMVLSTMFAVSVPVFALPGHSPQNEYGGSPIWDTGVNTDYATYTISNAALTVNEGVSITGKLSNVYGNPDDPNNSLEWNKDNSGEESFGITGYWTDVDINTGLINIESATITDTLSVDGGNVSAYGTFDKVTIAAGASLTISFDTTINSMIVAQGASVTISGNTTITSINANETVTVNSGNVFINGGTMSKGLNANGGVIDIANTTISDSTLAFADDIGIVNISAGAVVNLNQGASIAQTESARTAAGTMLAVFNAGTFTMTGSSIVIKTDGNTLSKGTVALRGIYNYMSGSVTDITSGSISLINGNDENIAVYNQGALTLGVHDDVLQNVTITVNKGGKGIQSVGNGSFVTIYDADINVTGGYGTGILADEDTVLEILSGPDTVGADLPTPTVSVAADVNNGTALEVADGAKWAIAGGYKTAVFTAGYALYNASTGTPSDTHSVYDSGKPLTTGYFMGEIGGTVSDLNNLIPSTNYVVDNESANVNAVVDLRWEVQNAFESGTPVETNDTSKNGNTYTYSLPKDITFGEDSSLHGRTATTTVALDAKNGREIVWNGYTIDHCTSAGATSTTTGSALYYYTQDSVAAPNGSANLYYNLGTGAYLEYSSAPGLTANYSDLSSLIVVANGNNPGYLKNIVVFKGDHSLNVTPNALNTPADPILVKPHDAQATTLTITGAAAYAYYVNGEDDGAVDASTYAKLVVNAANADVYVTGEFASVDVQAGTVHISSGAQVVSLTQTGGTLYTENGVTSNGTQQVTLNAAVAANATATAIGTYYSVIKNGDGDLTIGDETNTSGTSIANGLFNNAGTATAIYATVSALNQDAEGSRAVTVSGGEVILATGAAVYKNNEYDSINGRITGVYVAKYAMLTMLTGSSIYLEATPEQTVALYGVDNHGTADLQSGSIELVKGAGNYGVDSYEFVKLGVYNDTTASINITVDKAGTGLYVHADSEAYVYGTDILTKLGGTGIKAGSGSNDTSSLIIMAGTSTVGAILPTPTVKVTAEDAGTALSIESNVKWAIAGGYKTAVFTGATALDAKSTKTPTVSDVHDTNVYALKANKPLTAGHFIGTISGTYGLDQLVPSESTSHSEATNYMTTGQAIVDLSWELKNVMEKNAATDSNYSGTTYTFPACISYDKISTTLHGHYEGDPVVHTSNAGITIDLNDHTWTASSGAIALNATQNVYLTNGGIHAAGNDAVVHKGGLLFMYDMGVASSSGSAIWNIDGTVLGLFDSALYGSVDTLDITTGPAFMLDSYVIASETAIKHNGGAPLVIFSSTVGAVTGHAVDHIGTGSLTITSGGAFTSNGGNVIELQGSGEIDILDAEITAKDSYIAINDQLASPGSLNIEDATVTAASGHAIYYQGVTDLDITNSTVSAIDQNAVCNNATGTLTVSGGTITSTNGEAVCIDNTGASFIDGATVSSQNNNAIHQKQGTLTITSGAFESTVSGHGIWVEAGATKLTIVNGTFAAINGYGLLVDDHAKLTPLTAGTFSSVKDNTPTTGKLYHLVEKTGNIPTYTFRDKSGDELSAWDLNGKAEITTGAIATFYVTDAEFSGPFTVVSRPGFELYYTSSDAITYSIVEGSNDLQGNDGDWYAKCFTSAASITLSAAAGDGYLIKDAAYLTYGAFLTQGAVFLNTDLQGAAANQDVFTVTVAGIEDYVMSATGAAARTITLSAVKDYEHGSFGYKYVNGNVDYSVSQPGLVTVSAISGVAIKVADGNAISLGFKPDTDHAVHQNKTDFDGLTFTTTGGAFDTKDSLVTGTAVIDADHTLAVAFCDMTVPVAVSTAGVTTDRSTYTGAGNAIELTGPTTNSAVDAHNLIDLTAGTWKYTKWNGNTTTSASVYITPNGNKATVYATEAGVATFEFTPAVSPAAAVTPDPVTFTVTFTEPPTSGGGGGGGGGGAAAASYDVSVTTDSSDIKADKTKAAAGDTVTITVPEGTTGVTITDEKGNVIPVTKVNDTTYTFKMPSSKVKVATEKATGLIRFVDVPMDKYYYDAVNWAVANGITTGTDATHFSPDALTDRAQFVTFLWRAAGSPEPTGDASTFKDVSSDKYYAKAVAWAVENGITNGLEADQFGPTVPVSRAHVVTFLYRFAKASGTYSSDFVDLKKGDFYEDAAGWAVENGITTGIDATHFNPDGPAVRAQTITFLYRYFTK